MRPGAGDDVLSPRAGWSFLRAVSAGAPALDMLARERRWRVEAVFPSCVYLSAGESLVCLGSRKLGHGPLNVLCDRAFGTGWTAVGRAGDEAWLDGSGRLDLPGACVDGLDRCEAWAPPKDDGGPRLRRLAGALETLKGMGPEMFKGAGLGPLAPWIAGGLLDESALPEGLLAALAAPSVRELFLWLTQAFEHQGGGAGPVKAPPEAAASLLGLGPGLTPSGDDFLAGVLVGLRCAGSGGAAEILGVWLLSRAAALTNRISLAHLRQAAGGAASEALHRAARGLFKDGGDAREAVLGPVRDYGHTSGLDALAGLVLVAASLMTARAVGKTEAATLASQTRQNCR